MISSHTASSTVAQRINRNKQQKYYSVHSGKMPRKFLKESHMLFFCILTVMTDEEDISNYRKDNLLLHRLNVMAFPLEFDSPFIDTSYFNLLTVARSV